MKSNEIFIALAVVALTFGACSGKKTDKQSADSSTRTNSASSDTSVKQADSTRSFRNDRGTDSVSAGKSIPAKP